MKKNGEKRYWGFGLDASPQPLSKGEGLNHPSDDLTELVVCEPSYDYQTSNKMMWNTLKHRARENRQRQTEAERKLWHAVRAGKLGYKIRRQHPIDIYIADFICVIKRVIIEIDGDYHLEAHQIEYDKQRTFYLGQKGYMVIRFTNSEVENDIISVLKKIKSLLDSLPDVRSQVDL